MISFIVPAYNQAEYLEDCLESIYNQTVPVYEIIVVNDGSTDNSQEIAERYMFKQFPGIESPVKVINQVNKGLSSARNTGIMAATGQFIWPIDADDILKEDALEKMTQIITQSPNVDVFAPSFTQFGKVEGDVIIGQFGIEDLKVANRLGYFSVIKRSTLIEMGGYSPRMKWGYEDYHLWFDILNRGKNIMVIQDPMVMYRVKEQSMIHSAQAHHEELMEQIRKDFPHLWK